MTDPLTGERASRRASASARLGARSAGLDGAGRQRDVAAERGLRGLVGWLAEAPLFRPARRRAG